MWRAAMDSMSTVARQTYRRLVHETPGFIEFWQAATPLDEIKRMHIGARPAARAPSSEVTKIRAARLAARSGAATVITSGAGEGVLTRIAGGEAVGTLLLPDQEPDQARKRWLAGHLQVHGRLTLDEGAARVLREQGRSLLAVGVRAVSGEFSRGEVVACVDAQGREVARGLVNYGADDVRRIMGQPSSRIADILGWVDDEEIIHRDNLVLA